MGRVSTDKLRVGQNAVITLTAGPVEHEQEARPSNVDNWSCRMRAGDEVRRQ